MKDFTKQVSGLNPSEIPMVDTHFGMWMLDQAKPSSRQMVTIPLYLATLGYEKGRDVISSETIRLLGHIHSHYWFKRMKAHPVSQPVGYYDLVDTGE
jgi:hypothetical protein